MKRKNVRKKERNRKRLEEYTRIRRRSQSTSQQEKYKAALKEVENARRMHLAEKEEELNELEKKINKEKKRTVGLTSLPRKLQTFLMKY